MSDPAIKNNDLPHENIKAKLEAVPDQTIFQVQKKLFNLANLSWQTYVKVILGVVFLSVGIQQASSVIYSILYFEMTDDAQVAGHSTILNTKVGGIVSKIFVKDNAQVKKIR